MKSFILLFFLTFTLFTNAQNNTENNSKETNVIDTAKIYALNIEMEQNAKYSNRGYRYYSREIINKIKSKYDTILFDGYPPRLDSLKFTLKIYNRWGQLLFSGDETTPGWNGNINNLDKECPESTYYFSFKYLSFEQFRNNDCPIEVKGEIILMRK